MTQFMTMANLRGVLKRLVALMPIGVSRFLYRLYSAAKGDRIHVAKKRNLLKNVVGSADGVRAVLLMDRRWVHYPDYRDRARWNDFLGSYKDEYISRGEALNDYDWQLIKATDYLEYQRSGNQMAMEVPFRQNIEALTHLFMAELAEGRGRFLNQIINGAVYHCEMTSWAFSAHLWMQKQRGYFPDHDERIVEMGAGKVASLLAWIYYFLKPELDQINPLIAKRIRDEVEKRVLSPYMEIDNFWWMGFTELSGKVNNWNTWCNSYVLQCFMLLEDDSSRLAGAIYRIMDSLDCFINYAYDDGACEEGTFYWEYSAGRLYECLQLLHDCTGGAISVFDKPIIRNLGEYIVRAYAGKGWTVNFSDATARDKINADLLFRYGKATQSKEMTGLANQLRKIGPNSNAIPDGDIYDIFQSLLHRKEFIADDTVCSPASSTWYPDSEICYMNGGDGFFVAAKGGHNGECHNHNDVGSIIVYSHSIPVFIDPGVGTYERKTFGKDRYSLWTMQSGYHNLPEINNFSQKDGAEYKASEVLFEPERMEFSLDMAKAYPQEAKVNKWVRSCRMKNDSVVIRDSYSLAECMSPVRIRFMTWGSVVVPEPGVAVVSVGGEKVRMTYDKTAFSISIDPIHIDDPRLYNIWGGEIYRLSLVARSQSLSGSYTYVISRC